MLHVNAAYLLGWIDTPELSEPAPADMKEAIELYKRYKNAIPQVQSAVEALLKPSQPSIEDPLKVQRPDP